MECREQVLVTIKCDYCGKHFCAVHKAPDKHSCEKAEKWKEILKSFKKVKGFSEIDQVARLESEYDSFLEQVLSERLDQTVKFGKGFSILELALYLRDMFGASLFFDSLLTIVQQYSLADAEISPETGRPAMRTGFNLALFGHPGTGKTFASYDMILGNPRKGVPPYGLVGRNRYCGGMTAAKFVEIGQAYEGKKYVFIVTEFNDWFKYKGMVEPLKVALEGGTIQKETMHGVIRPYRFTSYFSANYNVKVKEKGYKSTTADPNFNAIEDRMVCRLHRLTQERYRDIAESAKKVALGKIEFKLSSSIRDHLTLVNAIESGCSIENFEYKPILLTEGVYDKVEEARDCIMDYLKYKESLDFSPRLETKAIQLACAMSLLDYFRTEEKRIPINPNAVNLAIKFYVEEASIRSKEEFKPEWVLRDLGISPKFIDKTPHLS
jgi:hypothetical protein